VPRSFKRSLWRLRPDALTTHFVILIIPRSLTIQSQPTSSIRTRQSNKSIWCCCVAAAACLPAGSSSFIIVQSVRAGLFAGPNITTIRSSPSSPPPPSPYLNVNTWRRCHVITIITFFYVQTRGSKYLQTFKPRRIMWKWIWSKKKKGRGGYKIHKWKKK
jgi:hypothetical protein